MTQLIMELTKPWNIEYMGLKWKNGTPWYDYNTFRYMPSVKKFLEKQPTVPPSAE